MIESSRVDQIFNARYFLIGGYFLANGCFLMAKTEGEGIDSVDVHVSNWNSSEAFNFPLE